ncbi:hypothetical protein AC481_01620 [miscellaneous Crenarchaeota group archaeon SMTZ-80]|nr:MAG: hypothetical protein AC481_01620 [miscellaneous Crenarchaeota group archaeon SMTZ-80]
MKLVFRKMEIKDVPQVHKIECQLFTDPWPEKCFIRDIEDKNISHLFIVEHNGEIIGYIICWYYANEIHIGNVAVAPRYQKRGVGKYLLQKIFRQFPEYDLSFLEVRENNQAAISLYKQFGFKQIYKRMKYYSNKENALVMVKYRDNE